jgi:hypothetical protein
MIYSMTQKHQMDGWLANNELNRMWKLSWSNLKHTFADTELRKTTKIFSEDNWYAGWDQNQTLQNTRQICYHFFCIL